MRQINVLTRNIQQAWAQCKRFTCKICYTTLVCVLLRISLHCRLNYYMNRYRELQNWSLNICYWKFSSWWIFYLEAICFSFLVYTNTQSTWICWCTYILRRLHFKDKQSSSWSIWPQENFCSSNALGTNGKTGFHMKGCGGSTSTLKMHKVTKLFHGSFPCVCEFHKWIGLWDHCKNQFEKCSEIDHWILVPPFRGTILVCRD